MGKDFNGGIALLLLVLLISAVAAENSGSKWVWGGKGRTINDNHKSESLRDREIEEFAPERRPSLFTPAQDYQDDDRPKYRPPSRLTEVDNLNRYDPQTLNSQSQPPRRYNNDQYPSRPTGSQYPRPQQQYPSPLPGRYEDTRSDERFEPNTRPNGRYDDRYSRPPGRYDQYPRPGGDFDRPEQPYPSRPGAFGLGPINGGPDGDFGPERYPRPRPELGPIRPGGLGPLGPGPSGNGGSPAILTGPVPSWEQGRGDGAYQNYDRCKCAHALNCISPGIQFGRCDGDKMYCCHNSVHEGGTKNLNEPGFGGGGGIRPGINGPRPGDRPYPNGGPIGHGGDRPVLSGPNPTGILSEGGGRPINNGLIGGNGYNDRPGFGGNRQDYFPVGNRPISQNGYDGNRPVLSGPRPTGILSEGGGGRPIGGNDYNRPGGNNLNGNPLVLSGPRPTGILSEGGGGGGGGGGRPGRPLGGFGGNGGGFGGNRPGRPFIQYDDDRVRRFTDGDQKYARGVFPVDKYEPEGVDLARAVIKEDEKKT